MRTMDNTTSLHGSRAFGLGDQKVTIIFGTLGTSISFFALIFAALTWYRSMSREDTAQDNLPTEHELEAGIPKNDEDANTSREHVTLAVLEGRVGDRGPGLQYVWKGSCFISARADLKQRRTTCYTRAYPRRNTPSSINVFAAAGKQVGHCMWYHTRPLGFLIDRGMICHSMAVLSWRAML